MGYRVHRDDDKFKVVEVNAGETRDVITKLTEKDAKTMSRNLNFGGGFDGWTPNFFLNKLQVSV
jgi:hypothetical protein